MLDSESNQQQQQQQKVVVCFHGITPRTVTDFSRLLPSVRRQQQQQQQQQRVSADASRERDDDDDDDDESIFGDNDTVESSFIDDGSIVVEDDDDDDDEDAALQLRLSQSAAKKKRTVQFQSPEHPRADNEGDDDSVNQFLQLGNSTSTSSIGTPFLSHGSLQSTQQPSSSSSQIDIVEEWQKQKQHPSTMDSSLVDPHDYPSPLQPEVGQQKPQQISVVRIFFVDFDLCTLRRAFVVHRWQEPDSSDDDDDDDAASSREIKNKKRNPLQFVSDIAAAVKSRWKTGDLAAAAMVSRPGGSFVTAPLAANDSLPQRFISIPGKGRYNAVFDAKESIYLHNAVPSEPDVATRSLLKSRSGPGGTFASHHHLFHFVVPVAATSTSVAVDGEDDEEEEDEDDVDENNNNSSSAAASVPSSAGGAFLILGCPPVVAPNVDMACALVSSQGTINIPKLQAKVSQQQQQQRPSSSLSSAVSTLAFTPAASLSGRSNMSMHTAQSIIRQQQQQLNDDDEEGEEDGAMASLTHTARLRSRAVLCWLTPSEAALEHEKKAAASSSSSKKKTPGSSASFFNGGGKNLPQFILTDEAVSVDETQQQQQQDVDGFASPLPPGQRQQQQQSGSLLRQQSQSRRALVLPSIAPGALVRWWVRRQTKAASRNLSETLICRVLAIHVTGGPMLSNSGGVDNLLVETMAGFTVPKFKMQEVVSGRIFNARIWPVDLERIE